MSTKSNEPTKSHKDLEKYWTEEQRSKAKPKPRPKAPGKKEEDKRRDPQ